MAEAPLPNGEPLGYETLAALVEALPRTATPEAWLEALLAAVRARTAAELEDDWTALVLERTAPTEASSLSRSKSRSA